MPEVPLVTNHSVLSIQDQNNAISIKSWSLKVHTVNVSLWTEGADRKII